MPRLWSFFAVITQVAGQPGSCDDGALLQLRNDPARTAGIVNALQGAKKTCMAGGKDCLTHLLAYRQLAWPQVRALEGPKLSDDVGWMPHGFTSNDDAWVTLPCRDGSKFKLFYRHIWKNAGWSIAGNLEALEGGSYRYPVPSVEMCSNFDAQNPKHLAFTFGRDPISRFLAGYAELEYRFRTSAWNQQRYHDIIDKLKPFPAGSVPRATAFVAEFLQTGIHGDGHVKPQVDFIGTSLGCSLPMRFVGSVESIEEDWARMFREAVPRDCQAGFGAFQDGLHDHPNSAEDKAKEKAAAEEVLNGRNEVDELLRVGESAGEAAARQRDMATMQEVLHTSEGGQHLRALCWIYLPDFVVFGYELPEQCQKDPALKELLEKTRRS